MSEFNGETIYSDQQYLVRADCPKCSGTETILIGLNSKLETTRESQRLGLKFAQKAQPHQCGT